MEKVRETHFLRSPCVLTHAEDARKDFFSFLKVASHHIRLVEDISLAQLRFPWKSFTVAKGLIALHGTVESGLAVTHVVLWRAEAKSILPQKRFALCSHQGALVGVLVGDDLSRKKVADDREQIYTTMLGALSALK